MLLGGSPSDASLAFAATVIDRLPSSLAVDVVSNRRLPTQRKLAQYDWLADVRPVLEQATVALSAAGSTVWELCATGVVPVIFAAAANQQPVGVALGEIGAASYLGPLCNADPDRAATVIEELIGDDLHREQMRTAGAATVDGLGASRVVARLRADLLRLRPATRADVTLLFEWTNDAAVRAMSFSTAAIAWDDHVRWLDDRLARPHDRTYIAADRDGNQIGLVRFDEIDANTVEIGVSVAATHRGRHWAAPLVVAGCRAVTTERHARVVHARVRAENVASIRAFAAAGFDHVGRQAADGYDVELWKWVKLW